MSREDVGMSLASNINRYSAPELCISTPPSKAVTDWIVAFVLLVLTAGIILVLMALVRLTSRGPAIYGQTRLGYKGQQFTIYKIRTMHNDCERLTGPQWSQPGDPRVTPIGRILRATHLDELPQLWNILRGEMSLVGPRPERPEIVAKLERVLPDYPMRLLVRPGVTGLAQVQLPPDSDIESVRRKLACDLRYLNLASPWLDLRIVLATAIKVVGIPGRLTCRWLRIPVLRVVDMADSNDSSEMDVLTQGAESIPQVELV